MPCCVMDLLDFLDEEDMRRMGYSEEAIKVVNLVKKYREEKEKATRLVCIIEFVITALLPYIIITLLMVIK